MFFSILVGYFFLILWSYFEVIFILYTRYFLNVRIHHAFCTAVRKQDWSLNSRMAPLAIVANVPQDEKFVYTVCCNFIKTNFLINFIILITLLLKQVLLPTLRLGKSNVQYLCFFKWNFICAMFWLFFLKCTHFTFE